MITYVITYLHPLHLQFCFPCLMIFPCLYFDQFTPVLALQEQSRWLITHVISYLHPLHLHFSFPFLMIFPSLYFHLFTLVTVSAKQTWLKKHSQWNDIRIIHIIRKSVTGTDRFKEISDTEDNPRNYVF